jgi:hypothetical protein
MKTEWGRRNPDWRWRSTWRSEYSWHNLKLSPLMREGLKNLEIPEQSQSKRISAGTLAALRQRHLVDVTGTLTDAGTVAALYFSNLLQQCRYLDIPVETIELERQYDDPAVDGMYFYIRHGQKCCYSEGSAFIKILYCLYYHRITDLTKEGWKYFMEGLGTVPFAVGLNILDFEDYIKDYSTIENDILTIISEANKDVLLKNFRTLFKKGFCWFGADEIFVSRIFDCLGVMTFVNIFRAFMEDPYAFSQGWPDLLVVDEQNVHFVEVKANDKLTLSQLITIPAMTQAADISAKVLRINRKRRMKK